MLHCESHRFYDEVRGENIYIGLCILFMYCILQNKAILEIFHITIFIDIYGFYTPAFMLDHFRVIAVAPYLNTIRHISPL